MIPYQIYDALEDFFVTLAQKCLQSSMAARERVGAPIDDHKNFFRRLHNDNLKVQQRPMESGDEVQDYPAIDRIK